MYINIIKNPLRTFLGLNREKIRTSRLGEKKGVLIKKKCRDLKNVGYFLAQIRAGIFAYYRRNRRKNKFGHAKRQMRPPAVVTPSSPPHQPLSRTPAAPPTPSFCHLLPRPISEVENTRFRVFGKTHYGQTNGRSHKPIDGPTDRLIDGPTYGPTDEWRDGQSLI